MVHIIEVGDWRFCWKPGDRTADVIYVPTGEMMDAVEAGETTGMPGDR